MTDTTNQGAGAGGAIEGTQGAGAATGAGAAAQQGGTGGGNTPVIPWLPNASAEEIAFAQSKGWDKETNAPADQVFRSYHNLQKLFGADKAGNTVVLPADGAEQATVDAFYNRLGRPEAPEKYTAEKYMGLSDEQDKGLRETAHKLGLTEKQFLGLKAWNDELGASIDKDLQTQAQIDSAAQEGKLKQEWGAAFDQKFEKAQVTASQLGLQKEQIDAMQMVLGYDGVFKLMDQIGKSLGEGAFVTGDKGRAGGTQSNVMTPEQAQSELNKLGSDQEFQKAWMDKTHPKHKEMVDRKSQLSKWATGGK